LTCRSADPSVFDFCLIVFPFQGNDEPQTLT
jgi:hypothetical protein